GGKPGVFESADGGTTWRRVALPRPAPGLRTGIFSAADPQTKTLYFAEQNQIFASTDAGRAWHRVGENLPQDHPLWALAAGGGTVIASFGPDGLYTSTNEGRSWTRSWPASGSVPGLGVRLITVDSAHPEAVIAAANYPANGTTATRILRSSDGGR